MASTYQSGANPPIDYPRFLIHDVGPVFIFSDEEITMATTIQALTWQSGMFWSGNQGVAQLPTPPVSYRRVAATLLDSLASNASRLSAITKLLDVELAPGVAAKALRDQAQCFRDEDDAGAFVIIEQVNDMWSFRDRWWKTVQRQIAN